MKKLGIAISLYNRLPELLTNVNIIRKHWSPEYRDAVIGVCSNDRETFAELEKNKDIDVLIPGNFDIPSSPKPLKRLRQWDCITRSTMCISDMCKFTFHYHADFFAVKVEPILEIIEQMGDNKHIAFRGRGLGYSTPKNPEGDCDDHSIIFRNSEIVDRGFFDFDPREFLVDGNVEGLLAKRIKDEFSENTTLHYSNMEECEINLENARPDSFYKDGLMHRNMHEWNIDRARQFGHSSNQKISRKFLLEFGVPEKLITFGGENPEDKTISDWLNG